MWKFHRESGHQGQLIRWSITQSTTAASYATVINAWQRDATFRDFFINLLKEIPYTAFRWETPPVTNRTVNRSFECVAINSPELAHRPPDPTTFSRHFKAAAHSVVSFDNLGRDARLIVPCPQRASDDYSHLGAFNQQASQKQQHELWRMVGQAMVERLNDQPVWLSTAGGGVPWLHVRLDNAPKYYRHQPYCLRPTA